MTEVCLSSLHPPTDNYEEGLKVLIPDQIFPIYSEIELAIKNLPKWMKDEGRMGDAALFFKPMRTYTAVTEYESRLMGARTQDQETTQRSRSCKLIISAAPHLVNS